MAESKKKEEKNKKNEEKKSSTSTTSNVKSRLENAYSNVKPSVNTYEDGASLSVGDSRVGGVTSRENPDGSNYYGVYADNVGNP